MIICSHSNIDIIQGVIGYGDAEGITDWRITNTNTGILNILNSTSTNVRVSMLENGNVGIGTTNPGSMLDIVGDTNITGIYKKNNRDVINDTSNYVLSTSNTLVPRILTEVGNGSNYISILNTALNTRVDNTSNYVLSTSNIFANSVSNSQWTNVSPGINYNGGNVGIGTTNPVSKLHIYNDTISNTKLTIQNNFTQTIAISSSPSATTSINGNYTNLIFTYTSETGGAGTGQTLYTITVPGGGVVCDVLIVAGGGGGGMNAGAGGGAGGLILLQSTTLAAGNITIRVGDGGAGGTTSATSTLASNGFNSIFGSYTAIAGGAGVNSGGTNGNAGGSGGGAGNDTTGNRSGGAGTSGQGFKGGDGTIPGGFDRSGGGGGGAGAEGQASVSATRAGNGGVGRNMSSIFGTSVGQSGWFAGGGAGGVHSGTGGTGGTGGGGSENVDGTNGTGGGGGAARSGSGAGRKGGSGIVIIRYLTPSSSSIELLRGNSTYKIGNYGGDFKIMSSTSSVDTDYIKITSTGASIYNPTGSPQWSTVSDRRIKENIEKASYDKCYDNINKLELYRFNYIKELKNINKDLKQLGYIAQEVQDIFPKAVSYQEFHNDNLSIADMLSIDIAQINYSLYGAVKKLIEVYNDIDNNIKILENILKIKNVSTSNVAIDTSNVAIDTSNVIIDKSNVAIDTSNIAINTSNVAINTSNVAIDDTSMLI